MSQHGFGKKVSCHRTWNATSLKSKQILVSYKNSLALQTQPSIAKNNLAWQKTT